MVQLPDKVAKLFREPNFAYLTTLMADGSPQVSPVWVDYDGKHIVVNTAEGRAKPRNVRKDPRVAVAIADRKNPYQYAGVRGKVVEVTRDGADAHIDKMAKKYIGQESYPWRQPGEKRVLIKIEPEKVFTMG